MRNCRTSKIDGEIEIYRNDSFEFNPEPTTLPYVFFKTCFMIDRSSVRIVRHGEIIQLLLVRKM